MGSTDTTSQYPWDKPRRWQRSLLDYPWIRTVVAFHTPQCQAIAVTTGEQCKYKGGERYLYTDTMGRTKIYCASHTLTALDRERQAELATTRTLHYDAIKGHHDEVRLSLQTYQHHYERNQP